jgi:hypothetical protein
VVQAVVVSPVTSFQVLKRLAISRRYSWAGSRWTGPEMGRYHTERGQEPLCTTGRAELFHGALPHPGGLVGVLGPVVQVLRLAMLNRSQHATSRRLVAAQLVGDQHPGHVLQALEKLAKNLVAARVSRRDVTKMSSALPSWSTARHR